MNGPERYRTLGGSVRPGASDPFGTAEGIDPVTGLPVLIYDFDGEPLASADDLVSENIPRILWSGSEAGKGRLVAALSPGWQRLDEGGGPLSTQRLLEAARALRVAAAAGVAHGDLTPARLLIVDGRLQVEGYGVPRPPRQGPHRAPELSDEATLAGDVYALARSVEAMGHEGDDETVDAVLDQCLAEDPRDRPTPEELCLALEAIAGDRRTVDGGRVPATPGEVTAPSVAVAANRPSETGAAPQRPPGEGPPRSAGATAGGAGTQRGEDPPPLDPPAGTALATGTEEGPDSPPPDRPDEGPRERRISLTLLGALMAAVVILALLALYGPRAEPSPPRPLEDVVYVVEVEVVPADLPPVTIHVIRAPSGSSYARSDVIGTAPRHLALDRPGTWEFQGSLQDRRSEVVRIDVPEERTVTLIMPGAGTP